MSEETISRTTLYIPKYLHIAAKERQINFSKEFTRYLETILYGENGDDIRHQYEQLLSKKKTLSAELISVNSRLHELKQIMDEASDKLRSEQELYDKLQDMIYEGYGDYEVISGGYFYSKGEKVTLKTPEEYYRDTVTFKKEVYLDREGD